MTNWIIRRARPENAEELASCIDAAYENHKARIPSMPDVSGGIDNDIRDHSVWVAVAGDHIVGGMVLMLEDGTATLANIAVLPDQGGKGLGRALIELAETRARLSGATELKLTTHVAIPENVEFYKRLGWRESGRQGNKVQMVKAL